VHDPVDIRRRIDRLVARVGRRDDYGQLLVDDFVAQRVEDIEDPEAWRSEIRRQARVDKIKIRTGNEDGLVWALRARRRSPETRALTDGYHALLSRTVPLAAERRHEAVLEIRDGDEVVCSCERCSAVGYASARDDVVGGSLFEDECPNEEPPKLTPLAMLHVPPSHRPTA
jgi:hypothetical protein